MNRQNPTPQQLALWALLEEPVREGRRVEEEVIIQEALGILAARCAPGEPMTSPQVAAQYLQLQLGTRKSECFAVLYLNSRHEVIVFKEHFSGSIDHAAVHPRVIAQTALDVNAAAVILTHNHPSGHAQPSEADRQLTRVVRDALQLFDIRVLDHVVVSGKESCSFAAQGLLP